MKQLSDRLLAHVLHVERPRLHPTRFATRHGALVGHSVAFAGQAVAGGAVDVIAITAPLHWFPVNGNREGRRPLAVDLAAEEMGIGLELAHGQGVGHGGPGGAAIGEKAAHALRGIAGLEVHVLNDVEPRRVRGNVALAGDPKRRQQGQKSCHGEPPLQAHRKSRNPRRDVTGLDRRRAG